MPRTSRPRKGSLQFYPRKRVSKRIPSVNWAPINSKDQSILGFITYKVGMSSALIKDDTEHSMTKGKRKIIPVTILEAPNMKIFSIRFHKNNKIIKEVIVSNDKELKSKLKVPKSLKPIEKEAPQDYDNLTLITLSLIHI